MVLTLAPQKYEDQSRSDIFRGFSRIIFDTDKGLRRWLFYTKIKMFNIALWLIVFSDNSLDVHAKLNNLKAEATMSWLLLLLDGFFSDLLNPFYVNLMLVIVRQKMIFETGMGIGPNKHFSVKLRLFSYPSV